MSKGRSKRPAGAKRAPGAGPKGTAKAGGKPAGKRGGKATTTASGKPAAAARAKPATPTSGKAAATTSGKAAATTSRKAAAWRAPQPAANTAAAASAARPGSTRRRSRATGFDPTPDLFESAAAAARPPESDPARIDDRAGRARSAAAGDADARADPDRLRTDADTPRTDEADAGTPADAATPDAGARNLPPVPGVSPGPLAGEPESGAGDTELDAVIEDVIGALGGGSGGGEPPGRRLAPAPIPTDRDQIPLSAFASRAYLDYAMSVLKARALPDVADGQKPVQRRILYVMHELGLAPGAKPMKSARVVGDVLGKYHPHGDTAAYDAMVRMAQDFSLRYPLVDGHGNYGSRDGDAAAAYRYTEARLTPFADHVLLGEIDQGTVDFLPNYDGAFREPALLPARLPVVLLNGASGIAVGMATEIPPHNLREVAQAAIAVIRAKGGKLPGVEELLALMPGPDFPGGGQVISAPDAIVDAYRSGRGTIRLRARWKFEDLARGQWQAVVTELPHGVSTARVLSEIEDVSNPKVRPGRKSITQEQQQQKALLLSVVERVRDESDKDHAVRIVIEPRTSKIDRDELTSTLLSLTSLETSYSINLVVLGRDGRPRQKDLVAFLDEWTSFRLHTVERRSRHRLGQVEDRLHVLAGRLVVHLNVDKVVRTIREAEDPRSALVARFDLSERQADDILEMRLRQLARLESIRIEQEIKSLEGERRTLLDLVNHPASLRRHVVREIEADAKRHGDDRRTLIKAEGSRSRPRGTVDEPVTLLVSQRGWLKTRVGHGLDPAGFTFKEGDSLHANYEVRTTDNAYLLSTDGRAYSVPVSSLPGGKSDGAPASSLVDLSPGARVAHVFTGPASQRLLLASSGGRGFVCACSDLTSRVRAGKQFLVLDPDEHPLAPAPIAEGAHRVVAVTAGGKFLAFPLEEMRVQPAGGRGVQTLVPDAGDALVAVAVTDAGVILSGVGRGGKPVEHALSARELSAYAGHRARKGRPLPLRVKPVSLRTPGPR